MDVAARLVGVGLGELAGGGLERRAEEQRLAIVGRLADDPVDGGLEAHVEHAVGLVDDEDPELAEAEDAAIEQVLEPAGGGDQDVGLGGLLRLLLEPDAAEDGGDAQAAGGGDVDELLLDLEGELAGRRQHEGGGKMVIGYDALDQRDGEGKRLARAGRRLDEYVVAIEDVLDDELLNCERRGDPALCERVRNRTRYAEVGEKTYWVHSLCCAVGILRPGRTHSCTEETELLERPVGTRRR